MDRIASLTSASKSAKRLSIGVDTEDSVDEYDDDMDDEVEGWSDDDHDDNESENKPKTKETAEVVEAPAVVSSDSNAKASDNVSNTSSIADTTAATTTTTDSDNKKDVVVAQSEAEAVKHAMQGATVVELAPHVNADNVRSLLADEKLKTTSSVTSSSSSSSTSSSLASSSGEVNYQETDLYKKLQALRGTSEPSSAMAAAMNAATSPRGAGLSSSSGGPDGDAPLTRKRAESTGKSTMPTLKLTKDDTATPAAASVVSPRSAAKPRDEKKEKKERKKEEKLRKKEEKLKSPRDKDSKKSKLLGLLGSKS